MSHLHLPDGVLPLWLWLAGWLAALGLVWWAGRASSVAQARRRVPLLAVISSLMLVAMSSEIVPLAYHVNLTVVGGVLLGPALAPLAAFIAVLMLAMLGHGGTTVVGLNTLVITAEMLLGWAFFRAFTALWSRRRVKWAAGLATVSSLALSTALLIGIVALGGTAATERETGALDPGSLRFENPFGAGLFAQGLFSGGEHPEEEEHAEEHGYSVSRFAAVVLILGPLGWVLEAAVTALILGYVDRTRPALIWGGGAPAVRPEGDESGGH